MNTDDRERIRSLHTEFIDANTRENTAFLRQHSTDGVLWYNLNKSNYLSQDHIVELWEMLHDARPDTTKHATLSVDELSISVRGDVSWVTYLLSAKYDFGDLAKVDIHARATEVWERAGGDWKLAHFHCSEHEPGNMGGK